MPKQNKGVYLIGLSAIAFFIVFNSYFLALQAQASDPNEESDTYIDINQDTIWHSTDDLNLKKTVSVNPGATLTIEKGAKIKFGKDINNNNTYLSISGGRLIASGTQEEPISITADLDNQYNLVEFRYDHWEGISDSLPSFLRYVEIYGGGYKWDTDCPECTSFFQNFIPMASAEIRGIPAVSFTGGKVHMENCKFHDNTYADIGIQYNESDFSDGVDNYLEIVNSNFEKNDNSLAVKSELWCKDGSYSCASKMLLKNNWYGSSLGPRVGPDYIIGGEKLEGDYTLDGFRSKSLIVDPVIIVPGIMGSAQVNNVWKIDPITHSFDDLISSLQKAGYIKNINLFEFPYEWRNNNTDTANLLKEKIQGIINETKVSKVDIVAHSMGGLVSRSYIEGIDYQNYNNVDQLITLGTPHKGAPKAYLQWEAGEGFFGLLSSIAKHHFKNEAEHAGYNDLQKYIQAKVPSVQELLPDYNYLKNASTGNLIDYGNSYPKNTFLEDLNKSENVANLSKVKLTNIVGNLSNDQSTISEIRIVESTEAGKWEHGMPENFYAESGDNGLEMGEGDETVPKISAELFPPNPLERINSSHSDLPTKAQCKIVDELTSGATCYYTDEINIPNILLINIFSPIDIQVVEVKTGKKVGKNFATGEIINEIEGAYYTGFDMGIDDSNDNEFLTIPNPVDGEYKILTEGTGSGEYKIEVAKITEDPATGTASESVAEITGTAALGQGEEKEINVAGNEIIIAGNQDTTPPVITGSATSTPNSKGWYNSDVIIHFTATDNESGLDFVTQNVAITTEGKNQSATGIARDKAGNETSFTISGINIDKTAPSIEISSPEAKIYLNNQIIVINYNISDNLSEVTSKIFYDGKDFSGNNIDSSFQNPGEHKLKITATDEAGNSGEKEITFRVETNIKAISDNFNHYATLNLIKNKADKTVLVSRLKLIQEIEKLMKMIENSRFFNNRTKEKLIKALEGQVNEQLNWLMKYVAQRSKAGVKNGIDSKIGSLLIESFNFVKF